METIGRFEIRFGSWVGTKQGRLTGNRHGGWQPAFGDRPIQGTRILALSLPVGWLAIAWSWLG